MPKAVRFIKRHLSGIVVLQPFDEHAKKYLNRLRQGQIVEVDLKAPRNARFSAKYWVLCNLISERTGQWPTAEEFSDALKMEVGITTTVQRFDGSFERRPGSIAFSRMDEVEFTDFYNRCLVAICEQVLPEVECEELNDEVEQFIRYVP